MGVGIILATCGRRRKAFDGFTLLELIVVMTLMSLMLFFTIPKLPGRLFSDSSSQLTRWLMIQTRELKKKAVHEGKIYFLNINIEDKIMWATHDLMSDEELEKALEKGIRVPSGMTIMDILLFSGEPITSGTVSLRFFPRGYSDGGLIHLEDDEGECLTYFIQPLLNTVKVFNQCIGFEETYSNG